jgi:hypothetical protein
LGKRGKGRAAYTPQSGDRYELTVTPDNTRSVGIVTLPKDAPDLDTVESNSGISSAKTVTIKRPAGGTGYDAAWKEVFKVGFGKEAAIDLRFEDL